MTEAEIRQIVRDEISGVCKASVEALETAIRESIRATIRHQIASPSGMLGGGVANA